RASRRPSPLSSRRPRSTKATPPALSRQSLPALRLDDGPGSMSAPIGQSVEHGLIVVAWLFESERRYLFNVYEIGSPLAAAHGVDASDQKYFRRAPENQLEGRTLHQAVIGQRAHFDQLEFGGLRVTVGEQNLPNHGGKFGHGHGARDNNRVR